MLTFRCDHPMTAPESAVALKQAAKSIGLSMHESWWSEVVAALTAAGYVVLPREALADIAGSISVVPMAAEDDDEPAEFLVITPKGTEHEQAVAAATEAWHKGCIDQTHRYPGEPVCGRRARLFIDGLPPGWRLVGPAIDDSAFVRRLEEHAARGRDNESYRVLVPYVLLSDAAQVIRDLRASREPLERRIAELEAALRDVFVHLDHEHYGWAGQAARAALAPRSEPGTEVSE